MTMLLRRMGHGELTVHGFRSTFRDWSAETTGYPREVAEMALAHAQGGRPSARIGEATFSRSAGA